MGLHSLASSPEMRDSAVDCRRYVRQPSLKQNAHDADHIARRRARNVCHWYIRYALTLAAILMPNKFRAVQPARIPHALTATACTHRRLGFASIWSLGGRLGHSAYMLLLDLRHVEQGVQDGMRAHVSCASEL